MSDLKDPDGDPAGFGELCRNTLKLGKPESLADREYQRGTISENEYQMHKQVRHASLNADFDGITRGIDQLTYDAVNNKAMQAHGAELHEKLKGLAQDFNGTVEGHELILVVDSISPDIYPLDGLADQDPEPKLAGDTTFGVSVDWINWYCRKHNTAIWKARKEGKRRLRKLKDLAARFNK